MVVLVDKLHKMQFFVVNFKSCTFDVINYSLVGKNIYCDFHNFLHQNFPVKFWYICFIPLILLCFFWVINKTNDLFKIMINKYKCNF